MQTWVIVWYWNTESLAKRQSSIQRARSIEEAIEHFKADFTVRGECQVVIASAILKQD